MTLRLRKKYLSLTSARNHLRVPGSGNPPSVTLLLYHINTSKRLKPNATLEALIGTRKSYAFTRKRLQEFARVVGWQYVATK